MAVHKRFMLFIIIVKGLINGLRSNGNRHGHVTGGKSFGCTQNIGRYSGMLYGEKLSCTAKSGGNFIINHKYTVSVTEFSELLQVERRIYTHPRGSLQDWLPHHRLPSMGGKRFLCAGETFHITGFPGLSIRTAEAIQSIQMDVMHHHGLIDTGI